jgi:prepilin-type N-terminal cleavage/methylation domain-containing protein
MDEVQVRRRSGRLTGPEGKARIEGRTARPGRVEDVVRTARRRRTAGAFTLIEILIALMVLSIGMASVLAVFIAGVRASREVVDESAAALSAKAVLVRILTEEAVDAEGTSVRVFLDEIVKAREDGMRHVWIHPLAFTPPQSAYFGDDDGAPGAAPVAAGSHYSWRCRASNCRSNPKNPVRDLGRKGGGEEGDPVMLKEGRIPEEQMENPDSDELWRLAIEIYRKYTPDSDPIVVFQTYVCTAHM